MFYGECMYADQNNNNVFFDLDGTLHQGDLYYEFILYAICHNKFKVMVCLPVILLGLIGYAIKPTTKWGLNLILFVVFFAKSDDDIKAMADTVAQRFDINNRSYQDVAVILDRYIELGCEIYLISGSPDFLICRIYDKVLRHHNVHLIATTMQFRYGSFCIDERCIARHKLVMLDKACGQAVYFAEGYSDSHLDMPVLKRCKVAYRVHRDGTMTRWDFAS